MKIKLLVGLSGPGIYADENGIVDWPDDEDAKRLIAAGVAEAVEPEPKAKRTTKATKRKSKGGNN